MPGRRRWPCGAELWLRSPLLARPQSKCHPQTIAVCQTRAEGLGLEAVVVDEDKFVYSKDVCGVLLQYPATDGTVADYKAGRGGLKGEGAAKAAADVHRPEDEEGSCVAGEDCGVLGESLCSRGGPAGGRGGGAQGQRQGEGGVAGGLLLGAQTQLTGHRFRGA